MRGVRIFFVALLGVFIVALGVAALLGCQMKADVMPAISVETMDSYSVNIANALGDGRSLEIPPEVLSGFISEKLGIKAVCHATKDNRLKLWVNEDISIIGKADIGITMKLVSFDAKLGELVLDVEGINIGAFDCPDFMTKTVLSGLKGYTGDSANIYERRIRIAMGVFTVDVLGTKVTANPKNVYIKNGKLYFQLG